MINSPLSIYPSHTHIQFQPDFAPLLCLSVNLRQTSMGFVKEMVRNAEPDEVEEEVLI